ncbi:hypothetical protein C8R42DRAFT_723591 [Lentinula raphanica]|nr:hypothetical protein C8R42DRAFT_723591 [Lentinula raphanica]
MPKPLVCRPGFGAAECSVLAYTVFTAFRRALRNNKEYSGISRGDEEAELLTVNFDAGSLMEDVYMWQEEYNAQNEEITDEAVPLKPFALDRRPPNPRISTPSKNSPNRGLCTFRLLANALPISQTWVSLLNEGRARSPTDALAPSVITNAVKSSSQWAPPSKRVPCKTLPVPDWPQTL